MKKMLLILFLYILVEGDNIIGDGLYVYHRGKHAVDELATKVDEYYPKVQAIDTVMANALSREVCFEPPDTIKANRMKPEIKRNRRVVKGNQTY